MCLGSDHLLRRLEKKTRGQERPATAPGEQPPAEWANTDPIDGSRQLEAAAPNERVSPAASGRASPDALVANCAISGTEVPLLDYISNIMKFADTFLARRNGAMVQEFVQRKGLDYLFRVVELQSLPPQFMLSSTASTLFRTFHSVCAGTPGANAIILEKMNSTLVSEEVNRLLVNPSIGSSDSDSSIPSAITILDRLIEVCSVTLQDSSGLQLDSYKLLPENLVLLNNFAICHMVSLSIQIELTKRTKGNI